jgi:hypothetical protein
MVALSARNVTFQDLRRNFNLQMVEDAQFFREWHDDLPELTAAEKQQFDRIQSNFSNLLNYPPLLENTVMVVVSRLLVSLNFIQSPLHVWSEPPIRLNSEDEGIIITGEIDALVMNERLWILVIAAKKVDYSLEATTIALT